jgi:phosphoribosyl 1,2-cyclic phosphate phosphodiesterase
MKGKFLFLGTGASGGVPVIGCKCEVCSSESPHNKRLRPSGLLMVGGRKILIDAGPDFRTQALKFGIDHLDGVMLTHTHFDHIAGIDDLRVFYLYQNKAMPCLLSKESFEELKKRYYYLFQPTGPNSTLSAQLEPTLLPGTRGEVDFLGVKISYFSYFQGEMKVTGYRIGDFAYVSDIRDFDDTIFGHLFGLENLVVSALRDGPAKMMFSLDEALFFSNRVGAKNTWLTHMNHELDFEKTNRRLPSGVKLAYDGLEIDFGI